MKENFYVSSDLGIDHVRVMAKQFHMKNEICLERASHVLRLEGLFATKKKKFKRFAQSQENMESGILIQKLLKVPLSCIHNSLIRKFYAIKMIFHVSLHKFICCVD